MLFNYKVEISYDGTNFYGFQRQINQRSIQEELETKLSILCNEKIEIVGSGRTDRYVHALQQVFNFKVSHELNLYHFKHAINISLANDIHVNDIYLINNDFHARYDATQKHYQYRINIGEYDVFKANYYWQIKDELDFSLMKEASLLLIGVKDFRAFSSALDNQDTIREIFNIEISLSNNIILIDFYGNGFLKYMVRKLVMILIDVGRHKKSLSDVNEILLTQNKNSYSQIAPAHGLYLMEVSYE
jgi:tRNA pseudouridine38-40 synthase